ncbi:MAG: sulfite exporter TauE/SafE family protein [Pseudomonadales bacterium]|jgi:sulfite exporter TauE/SafE|nr:sulfite exporter TauE/SafE family protein [Pseudomonadales bacterium]
MNHTLTLSAALLLGLAASAHCVLMCGGIASALSLGAARDAQGRTPLRLLISYQLGRVLSYSLAGLLFAAVLSGMLTLLDSEMLRRGLRVLGAAVLAFAALVAFGALRDPGLGPGQRLWQQIAPLARRLLPVQSVPRALAFGMVWGWMPCGFVYTVLLIATLQPDAQSGALTMAAFGLGTLPAMLATACGAQHFTKLAERRGYRQAAGILLLLSAALTLAGPWLIDAFPQLHGHLPFAHMVAH